jgi:hypothetical protein
MSQNKYIFVGFEVYTAVVIKSTIFWDITLCSPVCVNRRCHLLARWFPAELIYSTLKMEAICSSETSVDTQRTTRSYIPEDGTLQVYLPFTSGALFTDNESEVGSSVEQKLTQLI